MAEFEVVVERLTIKSHPNADRLELAQVGDYLSIVGKDQFETGDLAAYIPEASLVPQEILAEMGLEGKLAGPEFNRVKAQRFRGIVSQGLCYPARADWEEGQDVTDELKIKKYDPPVPAKMSGEVYAAGQHRTIRYDLENFKRFPNVLEEGEEVVFAEKLHGTFGCMGVLSLEDAHPEHGRLAVSSKGLGSRGLCFKPKAETNSNNLYLRVARHLDLINRLEDREESTFVLGEVFGAGVQDLGYGAHTKRDDTLGFRVFDVYVGVPGQGRYLNDAEIDVFCDQYGLERVPVLYRGPFSKEKMLEYTDGMETVTGKEEHIREGIVVRPTTERRDYKLRRVQLKSVSDDYLLRKDGTELT